MCTTESALACRPNLPADVSRFPVTSRLDELVSWMQRSSQRVTSKPVMVTNALPETKKP